MNKIFNRGLSLVLCVVLCFSLGAMAFAAGNPDVTLALDKTTAKENELPETISMTISTTEALSIMGFSGKIVAPEGFTLQEIQSMDKNLAIANVTTKKFAWMVGSDENVQNWAKVIFAVSDNLGVGTYTLKLTEISASHSDNSNPLAGVTEKAVTFTVTEKDPDPVPVTSVKLNNTTLNLTVGDSETLTAIVLPDNATNKDVTWASSNEDVATVDENGKVTAVKAGTAIITATAGGKKASCEVTVTSQPVPVTGISLDDAEVSVGRTIQLKPKFTPADTTQRGVTWVSSDETIATVDTNGNVKGLAEGTVSITVTSTEDANVTATCTVTVTKRNDDTVWAGGSAIVGGFGDDGVIFKDVSFRNYYYDAVKWAVDRDITSGTSRYTFSPDAVCTRAQTVTFLWRAAGCPKAENRNNPFTDVHTGDYFYEAVLWAVESGITNGTSAATFSPDATVSRAQVVTFLWRAEGQPDAAASGFADVSANAYYAKAVDWAFACGITTGMDYGTFGADAECTRAQIVTFLYRSAR